MNPVKNAETRECGENAQAQSEQRGITMDSSSATFFQEIESRFGEDRPWRNKERIHSSQRIRKVLRAYMGPSCGKRKCHERHRGQA